MPGPWQIFHVSPFLPLCPLPPLSSISVTELPGRRRASQPPPPPVYEPYTSIYQNPLFSARHGSKEGGGGIWHLSYRTHDGKGRFITYTGWPRPVTCAHFALPPSLSQFPAHTNGEKRQTNMLYRNSFCWRHGGGGGDISARVFEKREFPWLFFAETTSVAVSFIPTIIIIIALVCCNFFCSNLLLLCMFRRCLMRGRLMTAEAIKTLFIPSGAQKWFKKF